MNELRELENKRAYMRLVASCNEKFSEYLDIINKKIDLNSDQRIELYLFCAFMPYLHLILKFENDEEKFNTHLLAFVSTLLGYKPEKLTTSEFEFVIESIADGDESLNFLREYSEVWQSSMENSTVEQDQLLIYAISGIYVELANKTASQSGKVQVLETDRVNAMVENRPVDMMSVMRKQSEIKDPIISAYMSQIDTIIAVTITHLKEVNSIVEDLS